MASAHAFHSGSGRCVTLSKDRLLLHTFLEYDSERVVHRGRADTVLIELGGVEQRHRAVPEVLGGLPVTAVALRCGVTLQTVHRWLRRFSAGGIGALADTSSRGRVPRLGAVDGGGRPARRPPPDRGAEAPPLRRARSALAPAGRRGTPGADPLVPARRHQRRSHLANVEAPARSSTGTSAASSSQSVRCRGLDLSPLRPRRPPYFVLSASFGDCGVRRRHPRRPVSRLAHKRDVTW